MKYLLGTHIFIWFINGDKRLPDHIVSIIRNGENICYLSMASIWEIAIKISLGRLEIKSGFENIKEFLSENDIKILPITFDHFYELLKLQFHHRDPFDRIIVSQSKQEQIPVITIDEMFTRYNIQIIS